MSRSLIILALAAAILLPGCAARSREAAAPDRAYDRIHEKTIAARKRAYQRLIGFIEPGMTRRQLYALLPPARSPKVEYDMIAIAGVFVRVLYTETYPLDPDFSLRVLIVPIDHSVALKPRSPRKSSTASTTIDQLLAAQPGNPGEQAQPPKPNLDDQVAGRPQLLIRTRPAQGDAEQRLTCPHFE